MLTLRRNSDRSSNVLISLNALCAVPCVFVWMLMRSCVCLQCDMQKLTVEELKRLLYDTFCDHLSMKDIENIIMTEENHIENPEDCQLDIDSKDASPVLRMYNPADP